VAHLFFFQVAAEPEDSASRLNPFVPKIADFGLARLGNSGTTASGALLGTPSYMAPEQARGAGQVGPAADVYALGAILYECLTGRPPFRAATAMETLDQVCHREPVHVRSLAPGVPRDLETICHKCLEKEPQRRYGSAAELADDLSRFLAGEAVKARPLGRTARTWRWCRRNPRVAGLLAALVLVFASGFIGVTAMGLAAWVQKVEADRQRARAEDRQRLARRALQDLLRVAEQLLENQPRMTLVQLEMFERALSSYQELAQDDSHDPELRFRTAQAYHFIARIRLRIGQPVPAEQSLREQLVLLEELAEEDPGERKYRFDLFHCRKVLAVVLRDLDRVDDSEEQSRLALALIRELVHDFPDEPFYRDSLAHQAGNVGALMQQRGQLREAEKLHREGLAVARALVREYPLRREHPFYERNVMFNLKGLAAIHALRKQFDQAEKAYRESLLLAVKLAEQHPEDVSLDGDVAFDQLQLAGLLRETSRLEEAEKLVRAALARTKRLGRDHPRRVYPRYFEGRLCIELGALHLAGERREEAEKEYRRAIGLYEKMVEDFPEQVGGYTGLAGLLSNCPIEGLRDKKRALALSRRAAELTSRRPLPR
jgi:tetratricopeptide (TPR) repeat protein